MQLWQSQRPGQEPPQALGANRDWNIDLVPKFIMANGKLVRALVHTGVTRYMEFKAVDGSFVLKKDKVRKVPATDAEALKTDLVGFLEKRRLQKFFSCAASLPAALHIVLMPGGCTQACAAARSAACLAPACVPAHCIPGPHFPTLCFDIILGPAPAAQGLPVWVPRGALPVGIQHRAACWQGLEEFHQVQHADLLPADMCSSITRPTPTRTTSATSS